MKTKDPRPKVSLLHDGVPAHLQELMHLTRLAEMGRMAASVAHEINNPLMIAQGFAENIELMLSKPHPSPEDMRIQVLEIIKACQRMSRIVNKMNRLSKDQKLRLHVVDLAEVALNAVDFLRAQLSTMDVQLEFDFNHPMPVQCDVVQIEQIVLNILCNAISALEETPKSRRIRISFEEIGDQWNQVKIWNNGPVIPESVQTQIMSPFFSTYHEGQGLGLPVSKAIMEVHGGDLSFYSKEKLGTEFTLSFPRPKQNPWSERESTQPRGMVLVLDSQQNYRKTLEEKFRLLGFQVQAHEENSHAINLIKECQQVCGVLVDINPGLRESIGFVTELRRALGPKGLIFTMSHFPSARDLKSELKAAGATECFEKPLHADNFNFILKLLDSATHAAQDKESA